MKELSKQRYVSAYGFALVYLGLGDKEEALRWLEQSYQDRFPEITRIKLSRSSIHFAAIHVSKHWPRK